MGHTDRPWEAVPQPDGSWIIKQPTVFTELDGVRVAIRSSIVAAKVFKEGDAILMAEAPALLEALKRLINCHTGAKWQTPEVQRAAWVAAAEAVAKAEKGA